MRARGWIHDRIPSPKAPGPVDLGLAQHRGAVAEVGGAVKADESEARVSLKTDEAANVNHSGTNDWWRL